MATRPSPEQEAWDREVSSWERLQTGDLTGYLALLHDNVTVWPGDREAPVDKDAVFQHLIALLPAFQIGAFTIDLTRRSVRVFDDVAVIHYEGRVRHTLGPIREE